VYVLHHRTLDAVTPGSFVRGHQDGKVTGVKVVDLPGEAPQLWSWCQYKSDRHKLTLRNYSLTLTPAVDELQKPGMFQVLINDLSHELGSLLPTNDIMSCVIHDDNLFYSTNHMAINYINIKRKGAEKLSESNHRALQDYNSFRVNISAVQQLIYVKGLDSNLVDYATFDSEREDNSHCLFAMNRSVLYFKRVIRSEDYLSVQRMHITGNHTPEKEKEKETKHRDQDDLHSKILLDRYRKVIKIELPEDITAMTLATDQTLLFVATLGVDIHVLDAHTGHMLHLFAFPKGRTFHMREPRQITTLAVEVDPDSEHSEVQEKVKDTKKDLVKEAEALLGDLDVADAVYKIGTVSYKLYAAFDDGRLGSFNMTLPKNRRSGRAVSDYIFQKCLPQPAFPVSKILIKSVSQFHTKKIKPPVIAMFTAADSTILQWDIRTQQMRVQYRSPTVAELVMNVGIMFTEIIQLASFAFYEGLLVDPTNSTVTETDSNCDYSGSATEKFQTALCKSFSWMQALYLSYDMSKPVFFYLSVGFALFFALLYLFAYFRFDVDLGTGAKEQELGLKGWLVTRSNEFFRVYILMSSLFIASTVTRGLAYPFNCHWNQDTQRWEHVNLIGTVCFEGHHWNLMLLSLPLPFFFWISIRLRRVNGDMVRVFTVEENAQQIKDIQASNALIIEKRKQEVTLNRKDSSRLAAEGFASEKIVKFTWFSSKPWSTIFNWTKDKRAATCYHDFKGSPAKIYFVLSAVIRSIFPIAVGLMNIKGTAVMCLISGVIMFLAALLRAPYLPQATNAITLALMSTVMWCSITAFIKVWYSEFFITYDFFTIWWMSIAPLAVLTYIYGTYVHYLSPDEIADKYLKLRLKRQQSSSTMSMQNSFRKSKRAGATVELSPSRSQVSHSAGDVELMTINKSEEASYRRTPTKTVVRSPTSTLRRGDSSRGVNDFFDDRSQEEVMVSRVKTKTLLVDDE